MSVSDFPGRPKSYANQAAGNPVSTGQTAVDFGFDASLVRLLCDVGAVYFDFSKATGASTVDGFKMSSGEQFDFYDVGVAMRGFSFTSTSTGATFRYGAWG